MKSSIQLSGIRQKANPHNSDFKNKFIDYGLMLILALLFLMLNECKAQKLKYQIQQGDKKYGVLYASKTTDGNKTSYALNAKARIRFVFDASFEEKVFAEFSDGLLIRSEAQRRINNHLKNHSGTVLSGEYYKTNSLKKREGWFTQSVTYSVLSLYFEEPVSEKTVYSETHQKFLPITRIDRSKYRIVLPDGNTSTYTYREGICTEVENETALLNFRFVLED